jgi:hypothetical protein
VTEGTDEDDGKPYRVLGDAKPSEACPECSKLVPRGSIVCNHCGFNRQTGMTIRRVHEKVDKQWEPDFRFSVRFGAFLSVQGFVAAIFLSLVNGSWFTLAVPWLIASVLLAFILGSYARLNLTRSSKGRIRLTKTWRICFFALEASDLAWRDYEAIVICQSHEDGFLDWFIILFLLPWGGSMSSRRTNLTCLCSGTTAVLRCFSFAVAVNLWPSKSPRPSAKLPGYRSYNQRMWVPRAACLPVWGGGGCCGFARADKLPVAPY